MTSAYNTADGHNNKYDNAQLANEGRRRERAGEKETEQQKLLFYGSSNAKTVSNVLSHEVATTVIYFDNRTQTETNILCNTVPGTTHGRQHTTIIRQTAKRKNRADTVKTILS